MQCSDSNADSGKQWLIRFENSIGGNAMVSACGWLHSWKYRRSRSHVLACIVMFYVQSLFGIGWKLPIEFLSLVGAITYIAVWIAREGVTKKDAAYHVLAITLVGIVVVCVHIYNVNYWIAIGALCVGWIVSWVISWAVKKVMARGKEVL